MATNDFGVTTPSTVLDTTKTYHGMAIMLEGGDVIGRIQDWNATFGARAGVHLYEVNRNTAGRPIDYVPGIESGRSIAVTRVEVWNDELEVALKAATSEMIDLADQTSPFEVIESLYQGSTSPYRSWTYRGCWLASKSLESFTAEGDFKYTSSAEINYVIRTKS